MWKCDKCGKEFPIPGRISEESYAPADVSNVFDQKKRIIFEKPCCPFCGSIKFKEMFGHE